MKRILGTGAFLFLLTAGILSCKDGNNTPIPYVPINRSLTLANPQYNALYGIGGFVIITDIGAGGVLAVRATDDQIFAFDLQCTRDVHDGNSILHPDSSNLFLNCPVCHSQWLLLNGQLNKGPATFPLQQYQTTFDGFIVKIFN